MLLAAAIAAVQAADVVVATLVLLADANLLVATVAVQLLLVDASNLVVLADVLDTATLLQHQLRLTVLQLRLTVLQLRLTAFLLSLYQCKLLQLLLFQLHLHLQLHQLRLWIQVHEYFDNVTSFKQVQHTFANRE